MQSPLTPRVWPHYKWAVEEVPTLQWASFDANPGEECGVSVLLVGGGFQVPTHFQLTLHGKKGLVTTQWVSQLPSWPSLMPPQWGVRVPHYGLTELEVEA